ncbi:MAG: hypothetical protein KDD36_09330 [Flavobacteriales bacterium]|nr:hypothetical protein [Flavobacteriales bacterium]
MAKTLRYTDHLKKSSDLVTSRENTRAGFISMALEKNYMAKQYVDEARALKTLAGRVKSPKDLLLVKELRPSLLTASGLSEKALGYLTGKDETIAIKGLIDEFLEPAGRQFVDELVYRYLLIKGDALGGQARNLAGTLGERMFLRTLLSIFNLYKVDVQYLDSNDYQWKNKPDQDVGLEKRIKAVSWQRNGNNRVLILNVNVPIVNKNVDLCLLNGTSERLIVKGPGSKQSIHRDNNCYVALGELKGGIDPAGADEHWKTANSALGRIRTSFKELKNPPITFFVGAAIENSMADEIFNQLRKGVLHNAANLTENKQLTSLCDWLIHQ